MTVKSSRADVRFVTVGVVAIAVALLYILWTLGSRPEAMAQDTSLKPLEKPPEGQTYTGSKQCAACHFDQYLVWRKTKHAKAFDILPAKYRDDANCLKCHTTGFGEPTGYKDASTATSSRRAGSICRRMATGL